MRLEHWTGSPLALGFLAVALSGCRISLDSLKGAGLPVGLVEVDSAPSRSGVTAAPGQPAGQDGSGNQLPSGLPADNSAALPGTANPQIISDAGAALVGTVSRPDIALIANNSAALADLGGGMFYRLGYRVMGLLQNPVAQARVTFVDADGQPMSTASAQTDDQGQYRFAGLPDASDSFFVQADFTADGKAFRFRSLVSLAEGAAKSTADIDAATTLVSEKLGVLARRRELPLRQVAAAKLRFLLDRLRSGLTRERVPFMAVTSRDIAPGFDQLLQDLPEVREAAEGVAAAMAAPTREWKVQKVFDSDDLIRLGVYGSEKREFSRAGTFEVDPEGNFYFPGFPTSTTGLPIPGFNFPGFGTISFKPLPIYKVTPDGQKSIFTMLPPSTTNPVAITFGPDGTFYATAMDAISRRMRVVTRIASGTVQLWPMNTSPAVPAGGEAQPINGRVAVDDEGTLYQALPFAHFVSSVKSPQATEDALPLAGSPGQAGFVDGPGTQARFALPRSLARGIDGAVYVADEGNGSIRRISQDRVVTTTAGRPGSAGAPTYLNGRGSASRFGRPSSLVFDPQGDLFITDAADRRVRRLSRDGSVFLVAGTGAPNVVDGPGTRAAFFAPSALAIDRAGNLYVHDVLPPGSAGGPTQVIRKISLD